MASFGQRRPPSSSASSPRSTRSGSGRPRPAAQSRQSLVARQKALLSEQGFSRSSTQSTPPSSASASGNVHSAELVARQDRLLHRTGRSNASAASRCPEPMFGNEDDDDEDGGAGTGSGSVASRSSRVSHAPSLHPSVATSLACSESTIGAGDNTGYWDYQHRKVEKGDLGHRCRECRKPFGKLGAALTERRGARVSMRYHGECFSGFADPRSQVRTRVHSVRVQVCTSTRNLCTVLYCTVCEVVLAPRYSPVLPSIEERRLCAYKLYAVCTSMCVVLYVVVWCVVYSSACTVCTAPRVPDGGGVQYVLQYVLEYYVMMVVHPFPSPVTSVHLTVLHTTYCWHPASIRCTCLV